MGNRVGWCGRVEDRWEVSCREYRDWLRRLWRLCDPGVAGSSWVVCIGDRLLERVEGTVGCGCVFGTSDGMFNWSKVSGKQKFAFATLATLIAISMLATHTWCANVGPLPSTSKSVNSFTPIRVLAGTKNLNSNTTINKHRHHGGAVCPSYGVVSLDTPDPTRVTSSEGVGRGPVH
jgi:hypothetical protein